MTRLSPIHHAMARAMKVAGGPPCRGLDVVRVPVGRKHTVVSIRFAARDDEWEVASAECSGWWPLRPFDTLLPALRVPPSGGRGRVSR